MSEPLAAVTGGKIRGRVENGVAVFRGVPYAAPPVRDLRFADAQPVIAWEGVRDATAFGPSVPQTPQPPAETLPAAIPPVGDDCLNLNVWTPDVGGSGLPVFVWVHSGVFTFGSGAESIYDGTALARRGLVVVTINYRLSALANASLAGKPGNLSLRDQSAALRWVQDNIAAFGGDAGNVTLVGNSAGGLSALAQLASPLSTGLFHRVISQSGGYPLVDAEGSRLLARRWAELLGVQPTAEALAGVTTETALAAQYAVFAEVLRQPDPEVWGRTLTVGLQNLATFIPAIDGEVLQSPLDVALAQHNPGVPLLAGLNRDEARLFAGLPTVQRVAEAADPEQSVRERLAFLEFAPDAFDVYRRNRPESSPLDVLLAAQSDRMRSDTHIFAATRAKQGEQAFLFEFAWPSPVSDFGAVHALELPFLFGTFDAPFGPFESMRELVGPNPPLELSEEIQRAWVRFATSGNPGWEALQGGAGPHPVKVFDGEDNPVLPTPRFEELAAVRR